MSEDEGSLSSEATPSSTLSSPSCGFLTPPLPSFTVQTPPHLLLSYAPPPLADSAELTQSDRACRALCALFVYVCTSLWMCECETITGRWVTPLSVSCMLLICFDWWLSPIQTTHLKEKKSIKNSKTSKKNPATANVCWSSCILWCDCVFYCIYFIFLCIRCPTPALSPTSQVSGEEPQGGMLKTTVG